MPPRILVTRPAHDAAAWVDALQARGLPAQPLALMAIGPCRDAATQQALQAARNALREGPGYRAVMFVSGNAVQHFFPRLDARPRHRPGAAGPGHCASTDRRPATGRRPVRIRNAMAARA